MGRTEAIRLSSLRLGVLSAQEEGWSHSSRSSRSNGVARPRRVVPGGTRRPQHDSQGPAWA